MSNSSLQKRFIADEMVGKLARWLRTLGFDTLYFRSIEDRDLIDMALKEKRTILTRDTHLIERILVKDYVLIVNDDPDNQLQELRDQPWFNPRAEAFFSRCLECNTPLEDIAKEDVKSRVWPYTYQTHEHFMICPECDKIYWEGNHVKAMQEKLKKLGIYDKD